MFLVILTIFASTLVASFLHNEPELVRKVVGGNISAHDAHPWFAGLRTLYNSHFYCGGTIIGRRWILTAAHCLEDKDKIVVAVGIENRESDGRFSRTYEAEKVMIHEDYDKVLFHNDIALLKVSSSYREYVITVIQTKERIAFNEQVDRIFLPLSDKVIPAGTNLTVVGMGKSVSLKVL
ncbi:hypothetical protein L596_011786 [Steinernema carpocapsae]|uniref:Peptidase S1 domain-containing protein n=1 Tax=Steinernema carpocapsae TaxID=34508 RepID=A0A4U5NVY6_STECR|nr:hypothetical protein L596_011786 [Steinernema carpocapsae]